MSARTLALSAVAASPICFAMVVLLLPGVMSEAISETVGIMLFLGFAPANVVVLLVAARHAWKRFPRERLTCLVPAALCTANLTGFGYFLTPEGHQRASRVGEAFERLHFHIQLQARTDVVRLMEAGALTAPVEGSLEFILLPQRYRYLSAGGARGRVLAYRAEGALHVLFFQSWTNGGDYGGFLYRSDGREPVAPPASVSQLPDDAYERLAVREFAHMRLREHWFRVAYEPKRNPS